MESRTPEEIAIWKETIHSSITGMEAQYYHTARKLGVLDDENHILFKGEKELHALHKEVGASVTEMQVDEINKKVSQFAQKLKKIRGKTL